MGPGVIAPPRLRNFHHQLVDAVGRDIVSRLYAEGTQMPTEPQLAEHYGASRMIVREAMKSLAAKGLVSIRPRTGTHVLPRNQWHLFDPVVLGWHQQDHFNGRLISDLMELRLAIEPLAARLAAERGAVPEMTALREAFKAMSCATTRSAYIDADLRFHGSVVQACGNLFIQQLETALAAVWKTSFLASTSEAWVLDAQSVALHRALLDAIESHDAGASERAAHALIARATLRIESAGHTVPR